MFTQLSKFGQVIILGASPDRFKQLLFNAYLLVNLIYVELPNKMLMKKKRSVTDQCGNSLEKCMLLMKWTFCIFF